jgi:hypothetical protein
LPESIAWRSGITFVSFSWIGLLGGLMASRRRSHLSCHSGESFAFSYQPRSTRSAASHSSGVRNVLVHSTAPGRVTPVHLSVFLFAPPMIFWGGIAFAYSQAFVLAIRRQRSQNYRVRADGDNRLRAEEKGAALLRSWLSPEQAKL